MAGMNDPLEDRRQRAREVYADSRGGWELDEAIEVATQVKITEDIWRATGLPELAARAVVSAAFRAAGFEVVE
jgi:hypothetical protein